MPTPDPRTVAREIPGLFDSVFPQLTPGVVAHFNRTSQPFECDPVPLKLIQSTTLGKAMLFELGFAVGEALLANGDFEWGRCVEVAVARQRRHFDAKLPSQITAVDEEVALRVGQNLRWMMQALATELQARIVVAPAIPGFQWVASGSGDFSIGPTLIEVKCSSRNFSAADYRQIVMYWLLSFSATLATDHTEWEEGILLNPRSGRLVRFEFDELLHVIGAGRSKVEMLQQFQSMVGTRGAS
ncbi:hypothetical protein P5Y53_08930 [Dyella jiangningensis]|uniref:hypothetical protein n=1 Tax=Dyella jiangningensis TaxID=1379159 RepID=UPI00240F13E1|nr:hypothetical protein [Dyella jiangningensis]MDG2537782.1 hypothetical protein [Dyella jiangningensis]